ncbi:MAG: hypothetical protein RL742_1389, partial [Bacteroidota bacterium]
QIDINKTCLHVEVEAGYIPVLKEGLEEFSVNGRTVRVDEAMPPSGKKGKKDFGSARKWDKGGWSDKGGKGKARKRGSRRA